MMHEPIMQIMIMKDENNPNKRVAAVCARMALSKPDVSPILK